MMKQDYEFNPNKWVMRPQECKGTYRFDGKMYATTNVANLISFDDFRFIIASINDYVRIHNGADYLFTFFSKKLNKKIFVIDNLNDEMKAYSTADHVKTHNYYTIMLAEDY